MLPSPAPTIGRPAAKRRVGSFPKLPKLKKSDSHLKRCIHSMLRQLDHGDRTRLSHSMHMLDRKLSCGSACSGSEIARVVNQIVASFLDVTIINHFSCEKVPGKQEWIKSVIEEYVHDGPETCLFVDCMQLGQRRAVCCKHNSSSSSKRGGRNVGSGPQREPPGCEVKHVTFFFRWI